MSKRKNLIGEKYNHLTIIDKAEDYVCNNRHESRWLCECDCEQHNLKIVRQSDLVSGRVKSCGCLNKKNPEIDIGYQFGNWKIIDYLGLDNNGNKKWLCECNCESKTHKTFISTVISKRIFPESCGCLKLSKLKEERIGQTFGRLTIVDIINKNGKNLCKCVCSKDGNIVFKSYNELLKAKYPSCGCWYKEKMIEHNKANQKIFNKKLYKVWLGMKDRCNNPNHASYKYYGGKGIKICSEWEKDYFSFENWAFDNDYKNGLTIDRIDPNKDYMPENCRWITLENQSLNRTNTIYTLYNGKFRLLSSLSKELNIPYNKLYYKCKSNENLYGRKYKPFIEGYEIEDFFKPAY